ncbi:MAG: DsrE/DsrF/DrsH-like family protein, partial [Candidatus Riflebacteria bacterium]|nr:DsrE/DsrF/DrsH-like family protein [Candidatus Riflebacteria bacterium]
QLRLKILFDPADGKLRGAQAVGADGVDKRIDVLAVAIRGSMTVYDLEHLELSYAPPYGSAKDPVNQAGFVAANALRGDVALCHVEHVMQPRPDQVVVDVRTPAEVQAGSIPGARHVPLDELRARLSELDRTKEHLVYCQVGLRGYLACRILSQRGFSCRNLSGGYTTYQMAVGGGRAGDTGATPRDDSGSQPMRPEPTPTGCGAPLPGAAAGQAAPVPVRTVDARGLQCPGPVLRLKEELDRLRQGEALEILSSDVGFASDVPAWCRSTGNLLVEVKPGNGHYKAIVVKASPPTPQPDARPASKEKTIVVFSNDFDRMMAAFIIANGAAAMGSRVTLFFTFWGLNVLRRPEAVPVEKTLVERMFGWMMPRGAGRLTLSKMHMAGLGTAMIQGIMREKKVSTLPELIASARQAGVKLVACAMSMDLMGIKREELIDGVELGGVAMYLSHAEAGTVNLFI